MSDTYERIATDAIQILFMLSFNTSPSLPAIHKAADSLAARLETLGLIERRGQ
jgi:hypothetical protein